MSRGGGLLVWVARRYEAVVSGFLASNHGGRQHSDPTSAGASTEGDTGESLVTNLDIVYSCVHGFNSLIECS